MTVIDVLLLCLIFLGIVFGSLSGFYVSCIILTMTRNKKTNIYKSDADGKRLKILSKNNDESSLTKEYCKKAGANYKDVLEKQRKQMDKAYTYFKK